MEKKFEMFFFQVQIYLAHILSKFQVVQTTASLCHNLVSHKKIRVWPLLYSPNQNFLGQAHFARCQVSMRTVQKQNFIQIVMDKKHVKCTKNGFFPPFVTPQDFFLKIFFQLQVTIPSAHPVQISSRSDYCITLS